MTNKRDTRQGGLTTLTREGYVEQNHTGEAYAFFDSPNAVTAEDLRPEDSDLVLRFAEGEENFLDQIGADEDLRSTVAADSRRILYSQSDPRSQSDRLRESEALRNEAFGYGLHAKYGATNREAADQLAQVMKYVNGAFVPGNEPFRATVLYKDERGEYVARE